MLIPSSRVRVFVCVEAVDMRKSFAGLSGVARSLMQSEPTNGHVYLFFNRNRSYVKYLWWDRTGYCIVAKKLTQGTFGKTRKLVLTTGELLQVLEGIDIAEHKNTRLYEYLPD